MAEIDLDDLTRATSQWMHASFCSQMAREGLLGGRSDVEVEALIRGRFSDFRTGTECPECGEFDLHWVEQTQNHIAVIRECRSCAFRWEQC